MAAAIVLKTKAINPEHLLPETIHDCSDRAPVDERASFLIDKPS